MTSPIEEIITGEGNHMLGMDTRQEETTDTTPGKKEGTNVKG